MLQPNPEGLTFGKRNFRCAELIERSYKLGVFFPQRSIALEHLLECCPFIV
jgi:hypothetical protein